MEIFDEISSWIRLFLAIYYLCKLYSLLIETASAELGKLDFCPAKHEHYTST